MLVYLLLAFMEISACIILSWEWRCGLHTKLMFNIDKQA